MIKYNKLPLLFLSVGSKRGRKSDLENIIIQWNLLGTKIANFGILFKVHFKQDSGFFLISVYTGFTV